MAPESPLLNCSDDLASMSVNSRVLEEHAKKAITVASLLIAHVGIYFAFCTALEHSQPQCELEVSGHSRGTSNGKVSSQIFGLKQSDPRS